jgi:hypothetical protein
MKKNDAKFNPKKKKKRRMVRKASEANCEDEDNDEYGIEDEEGSGDEADDKNDNKIAAKNPTFKACLDVYELLKQKFP